MATFSQIMKAIICKKGRGNFITAEDFGNYVSYVSLRTEFVNFTKTRFLMHIARGLYYYPELAANGKQIRPTYFDVIKFVEQTTKSPVCPTEEAALLLVGLSNNWKDQLMFRTNAKLKRVNLVSGPELYFRPQSKTVPYAEFSSIEVRTLLTAYDYILQSKITESQLNVMKEFYREHREEIEIDFAKIPAWLKNNL